MTAAAAPAGERLNRLLARRGVASRREADRLIATGRVLVNGTRPPAGATVLADRDRITVDGRSLPPALAPRTLALNKPPGVVSTARDPQGRPTVLDLVDDPSGLFPVGRLDAPSRGLILLTNDGDLALRLTHPRYGITKTYEVTVACPVDGARLRLLRQGVQLEDGPARPVSVTLGPATRRGGQTLEVVMVEGRKREVRRLCAAVGLPVTDLRRTALGPVRLGRLREGGTRALRGAELRELHRAAGLEPPAR